MAAAPRLVTAGTVGRTHGLDGSFYVERPAHALPKGTRVSLAGDLREVQRRAGTDERPLVRVEGIHSREAARALRGELLLVEEALGEGEWLAGDLVGCTVLGLGPIARVIGGPSCDVLELEDGTLVPLVSEAVTAVDIEAGTVEVNRTFLGLPGPGD